MEKVLNITRPNITIDGRFAPGSGCWFTGERFEIENSNIFLNHFLHYGNDESAGGNSDCLRWGDWNGSGDCDKGYVRNCEFYHGSDEVFAFIPRRNGQATGPTVTNVTLENTIIANPINIQDHPFIYFIGDGTSRITNYNILLASGSARYPMVRKFSDNLEFINCAMYNFNENATQIVNTAGADFRSCLYRLGPRWNNDRAPILIGSNNRTYLEDILVDSKIGKENTHGLTREGTPKPTSQIEQSGLEPDSSISVESRIMSLAGAPLYGGLLDPNTQAVLDNFCNGNKPMDIIENYGPLRTPVGRNYPDASTMVYKGEIQVINSAGKLVLMFYADNYPFELDISQLGSGIYFISLVETNQNIKFIVQ